MSTPVYNESWTPQEPVAAIILERTQFIEQITTGIGYGAMITIAAMNLPFLIGKRNRNLKQSWWLLAYIIIMVILGTLFLAGDVVMSTKAWIDQRNFPGIPAAGLPPGPNGYVFYEFSAGWTLMANAAYSIESWMTDSLMLYRCLIVYGFNYWVILFPGLILLGSFTMGTMLLIEVSHPGLSLWSKVSVNLAIPFFSLSIALNFIVTLLIVGRLWFIRQRVTNILGNDHTRHYLSVSSMLIESAALTTTVSLLFLVPFARGSPIENIFQGLSCEVQIMASLLVILRVAQGRAWTAQTASACYAPQASMKFRTGTGPTSGASSTAPMDSFPLKSLSSTNGSQANNIQYEKTVYVDELHSRGQV